MHLIENQNKIKNCFYSGITNTNVSELESQPRKLNSEMMTEQICVSDPASNVNNLKRHKSCPAYFPQCHALEEHTKKNTINYS